MYSETRKCFSFFRKMRVLFCFFVALILISPAFAEGEQQQVLNKNSVVATASYVDGVYNAISTTKQDKLTCSNVVELGSSHIVTGVTANNGTVAVSKGEITISVGATTSTSRALVWFE